MDYVDPADGLRKRVLLPPGSSDFEEGIPIHFSLDPLYGDCPLAFRRRLSDQLYAYGLVEARDFLQPGAPERVRAAFISAVSKDAVDIVDLARKEVSNDSGQ